MRTNWVGATLVAHGEAEASPTRGVSCAMTYVAMYNFSFSKKIEPSRLPVTLRVRHLLNSFPLSDKLKKLIRGKPY